MFKAIIFDVDGTLTTSPQGNAWLDLTEQLGGNPREHKDIFVRFSDGEFSLDKAKKLLVELWNNCDVSEQRIREIYEKMPLRDGALEITNYLNDKNYKLCIITNSPNLFAEITAKRLNIPHYYGRTEFMWGDDGKMTDFEYNPSGDELKAEQLKDFTERQELKPEECVPVGDGWNDNKLFTATKNGIAIKSEHSDEELEAVAWKTIKNLSELKDIL